MLNLSGWRERGFYGRAYRVKQEISAEDLMQRLQMTLDHEVEVLEHQFARNARAAHPRHGEFRRSAHARGRQGRRRHDACSRGNASCSRSAPGRTGPTTFPSTARRVFDSDEILDIDRLPRTLIVIGAGVIGIEYATIFCALDVPVTLVEPRKSTILDFIDREIVDDFIHQLRDRGMTLRLGSGGQGDRSRTERSRGHARQRPPHAPDMVLYAAGRMRQRRHARTSTRSASRRTAAAA